MMTSGDLKFNSDRNVRGIFVPQPFEFSRLQILPSSGQPFTCAEWSFRVHYATSLIYQYEFLTQLQTSQVSILFPESSNDPFRISNFNFSTRVSKGRKRFSQGYYTHPLYYQHEFLTLVTNLSKDPISSHHWPFTKVKLKNENTKHFLMTKLQHDFTCGDSFHTANQKY